MAHRSRVSLSLLAAVLGTAAIPPLQAQQASQEPAAEAALGEVTVTATRRETSLQETPIAVTAMSADMIAASNPHDLGDLAKFAPGFSAARLTAFNAASFAIRGVGQTDIIVYQEAPVSVVVDDFVLPSTQTQLLDTFDLERVEILRGPQGTTFGKNTTGRRGQHHDQAAQPHGSQCADPAGEWQLRPQGRQARVRPASGGWQVRRALLWQVHEVGRLLPQRRDLGTDHAFRVHTRHRREQRRRQRQARGWRRCVLRAPQGLVETDRQHERAVPVRESARPFRLSGLPSTIHRRARSSCGTTSAFPAPLAILSITWAPPTATVHW